MDISTVSIILGIVSAFASIIFGSYRMFLDYRAEKRQTVAKSKQDEKYRLIVPEQAKKQKSQKRKRRFVTIFVYISLFLFLASGGLFVYAQAFFSHVSFLSSSIGYSSSIEAIALSPKGDFIASGFDIGTLNIYDVNKGHSYPVFQIPQPSEFTPIAINSVAWSPKGDLIAFGSSDAKVRIWDFNKGQLIYTYTGHTMPVNCVSWSPKGDLIASGGEDDTVQVWNYKTKKPIISYPNRSPVYSIAWSNDGKRIASAGENGEVNVWESNTGKNIYNYSGHTGIVWSLAWSPYPYGSYFLASAGDDAQVLIWNTSRYEDNPIKIYNKHLGAVKSIAWSPDGNDIVSASVDGTLRIWEAFTGNDSAIYYDFNYRKYSNLYVSVVSVAWSSDGNTIAYGHLEEKAEYSPYSLVKVLDFCKSWCLFHKPNSAS